MSITLRIEKALKKYLADLKEFERRNVLIKQRFIKLQCKKQTSKMDRIEWLWETEILPAHQKHREKFLKKKTK